MSAAQLAQTRIQQLEQQLADTQAQARKSHAQHMQARDQMVTARYEHTRREQGWRNQLDELIGTQYSDLSDGIQQLATQYHKLLDGYPDGMTPTDASKLKRYNAELEKENHELQIACDTFRAQRNALETEHEGLMFALVDAVKLAAVVAYPDTHRDADWRPMALNFMKNVERLSKQVPAEATPQAHQP